MNDLVNIVKHDCALTLFGIPHVGWEASHEWLPVPIFAARSRGLSRGESAEGPSKAKKSTVALRSVFWSSMKEAHFHTLDPTKPCLGIGSMDRRCMYPSTSMLIA